MQYRALGRTGVQVSQVGFGCGPGAGLMVYGTTDEQAAAVKHAFDLGVTYFDTAPIYGDYASEENLGRAIQRAGIRPHIATKVALELHDLDDIPRAVRQSVEGSLRRLGVDAVLSVQVHNRVGSRRAAKPDIGVGAQLTPQDVLGPVLDTLQQIRAEGKTEAIGCCAWGGELASIHKVLESGAFDTVLVGYSILNPSSGRPLPEGFDARNFGNIMQVASDHGTSAVVIRVLEGGALTGAVTPHPASGMGRSGNPNSEFVRNVSRAQSLRFLERDGQTLAQAAIRYALGDPRVNLTLVGFSALDQMDEAAAAADGTRLTEADLARIDALYESKFLAHETV